MNKLILLFCFFIGCHCFAQKKPFFQTWQAAFSNNHSAMPFSSFSSLFYEDFNPGFSFGPDKNVFHSDKAFLSLRFHYFQLQKVQHSAAVSALLGYKFSLPAGFYFKPGMGAGLMQAFPEGKIFELNNDGEYEKKRNLGRMQVLALLDLRLEKRITDKGLAVFMAYQQSLQAPFINEYVPLLPFNSLSVGVSVPNH